MSNRQTKKLRKSHFQQYFVENCNDAMMNWDKKISSLSIMSTKIIAKEMTDGPTKIANGFNNYFSNGIDFTDYLKNLK